MYPENIYLRLGGTTQKIRQPHVKSTACSATTCSSEIRSVRGICYTCSSGSGRWCSSRISGVHRFIRSQFSASLRHTRAIEFCLPCVFCVLLFDRKRQIQDEWFEDGKFRGNDQIHLMLRPSVQNLIVLPSKAD